MSGNIRRGANQCLVADLLDLHYIIRHQTVSAVHQLQRHLALADTALAGDQHTLAIDIHKDAVDADAGRQLHLQPAGDLR